MRKDSTIILLVSVLITALVIGGAYYLSAVRSGATDTTGAEADSQANPNALTSAIGATDVSAETSTHQTTSSRTGTPIKCQHPEIGEFWTNATTCEGADLGNRLSYSAPLASTPFQDRYNDTGYKTPARLAADKREDRKPDLRLTGKAPPDGLPVECKFPVGKALEIERMLSAADDPYQSTWRDTYCEFRCEVIEDDCPIQDDYFYYRYQYMCQGTEHFPCYRPQS